MQNSLKHVRPVILAGGQGLRLWPLSRKELPKQFISLDDGDTSLFQNTLKNMRAILEDWGGSFDACSVVSNIEYKNIVLNQISKLNNFNKYEVIFESTAKGTATALISENEIFGQDNLDSILIVIPSDQGVKDFESFSKSIHKAIELAADNKIVLLGVHPTYPSPDYGYIQVNNQLENQVISFHEKPLKEVAMDYLGKGNFFWNAGIFVLKRSIWTELSKEFCETSRGYVFEAVKSDLNCGIRNDFHNNIKCISVSYSDSDNNCYNIDDAVIEKACKNYSLTMVPIINQWSDLGTYAGVYRFYDKDNDGNIIRGQVSQVNTKNCFLYSSSKPLISIGLQDIVALELNDMTFLVSINEAESVLNNAAIKALSQNKLESVKVRRPWGGYEVLHKSDNYLVKKLWINPRSSISLQYHQYRSEHWYIVSGLASVTLNKNELSLAVNQSIDIPIGVIHKLENKTDDELIVLEIQFGDLISELDIVRLEDMYGRS